MNKTKFFQAVLIAFVFCSIIIGQSKSNLDQFNSLIDKSVSIIYDQKVESNSDYYLDITIPNQYLIFKNRIFNSFENRSIAIVDSKSKSNSNINYSLENVQITYSDVFRDGLFGSYLLERNAGISGLYSLNENGKLFSDEFELTIKDTVDYNSLSELENPAFPFTQGKIPPEPFLSGLFEPVVAIGAAALTIILFFTVRSK